VISARFDSRGGPGMNTSTKETRGSLAHAARVA
jgi:hypothetical protein